MPNFPLCLQYLGISESLYSLATRTLDWLQRDTVGRAALPRINGLIVHDGNVPAAADICRALKTHAGVFAPRDNEGIPDPTYSDSLLAAIMISCLPDVIDNMSGAGIPDDVIAATLKDFRIWSDVYLEKTGREGIWELDWNLLSMTGRILRIGRLQYETTTFRDPYYIYRHQHNGRVLILAAPGTTVMPDGHPQGSNGKLSDAGFTTSLRCHRDTGRAEDVYALSGNIVDTNQGIIGNAVEVDPCDYELILAPGMPITNIHIPADGPLTPESVDWSLHEADALLRRLHRHTSVAVCESWLMDPALVAFAPNDGNIVRFMRRFSKYPVVTDHPMIIERVFGWGKDRMAIADLPERTGLQRRLKAYLLQGGEVYDTGGILLTE